MVIFDLMVAHQLVQVKTGIALQLRPKSGIVAVQMPLRALDQRGVQLSEHPVPLQPKGREFVEIGVILPFRAGVEIGQNPQMVRQACTPVQGIGVFGVWAGGGIVAHALRLGHRPRASRAKSPARDTGHVRLCADLTAWSRAPGA